MKLRHPGIDVKVGLQLLPRTSNVLFIPFLSKTCTCSENKPWQHPIFMDLIRAQWWGKKGEAKKLGHKVDTNPFINTPIATMALVASAVSCFRTFDIFLLKPDFLLGRLCADGYVQWRYCGIRRHYIQGQVSISIRQPRSLIKIN